jgi:hypothetical protein
MVIPRQKARRAMDLSSADNGNRNHRNPGQASDEKNPPLEGAGIRLKNLWSIEVHKFTRTSSLAVVVAEAFTDEGSKTSQERSGCV